MLKSKLHRARVTDVLIDYEGSIEIDEDLLDEVGESGETGDAVFEREACPHGEDTKIDLLEVECGTSISHWPR